MNKFLSMHQFLQRCFGRREREDIRAYLMRIIQPAHPTDHQRVESEEFPGACVRCGHLVEVAACRDCEQSASKHVEIYLKMIDATGEEAAGFLLRTVGFVLPLESTDTMHPSQRPQNYRMN